MVSVGWPAALLRGVIRATRNPDEVRLPFPRREPARVAARRLVRGRPGAPKSEDFWPGEEAEPRPDAPFPKGEPFGEIREDCQNLASSQSNLSPHVRNKK